MIRICEAVSRALCALLLGYDMTLCAYAWWQRDRDLWRLWVRVFDRLLRRYERDHCRRSFERRLSR